MRLVGCEGAAGPGVGPAGAELSDAAGAGAIGWKGRIGHHVPLAAVVTRKHRAGMCRLPDGSVGDGISVGGQGRTDRKRATTPRRSDRFEPMTGPAGR